MVERGCLLAILLGVTGGLDGYEPEPRIKPLPLKQGAVNYPQQYIPPPFHREAVGEDVVWKLAQDLEQYYHANDIDPAAIPKGDSGQGPEEPLANRIHNRLRELLHTDSELRPVTEDILSASEKYLGTAYPGLVNSTHREFEEVGPEEDLALLNQMRARLEDKKEALLVKKKKAQELVQAHFKLVMDELLKMQEEAKTKAEHLYDEFSNLIKREEGFWQRISRNLQYRFAKEEASQKYITSKFEYDISKKTTEIKTKGSRLKPGMHAGRTIREMHNMCIFEQTSITEQLPAAYPLESLMPVSAHTACWCEGQLRQSDMQRSGMLDYYYNNYMTLRRCLNFKCHLCPLVYEAIWMDLDANLNADEICRKWAKGNYVLVNLNQADAFTQCKAMANGFVMSSHGLMTKTAEVFGNVEVLKVLGDCDRELAAMKQKLPVLSAEACKSMDCCTTGSILTKDEVTKVKDEFANIVELPPGVSASDATKEPPKEPEVEEKSNRVKNSFGL